MERGGQGWRIEVLAGGDTLRQERLTRDLHHELQKADGLSIGLVEDGSPIDGGRKGGLAGDVALWAAVTAAGRQASQILLPLIREWCARERHRKVELSYGGNSVTITDHPDETQERIVREFLEKVTRTMTTAGSLGCRPLRPMSGSCSRFLSIAPSVVPEPMVGVRADSQRPYWTVR
jgi:hypothetical protein